MTRAAVFGSGSWGTAFASVLADAGCSVVLHARRREVADAINETHVNAGYLPDLVLPDSVSATHDPASAADGADLVVLAIPSQSLRANLGEWGAHLPTGAPVVSLMKGIELGTGLRMSQVIQEAGGVEADRVVVLSGPNLSKEIAVRQPAAAVVACSAIRTAEQVAQACATAYFRPYTQTDVVGAELGGAVKNVIALAVGMAEGMGYGDNTKSTIITRGLAETARLGAALGADPATLMGLAGVGDLIATCMSPLSRNHSFGVNLGRGLSVEEVVAITLQTAEGVKSCGPIVELAATHGVDMPICAGVTAVVESRMDVRQLGDELMARPHKHERH
ncbi:NAD(P)H-dependent glycerol-3-phosphate dehydrogenase [Ornithinimicrobium cryptoxanthini]|uniref:Glycerol-3-phosphate dehydrogenase [NAD(P)+] n=1 Tax=Ornithinimicrobium cryptoxanthini TaxID=2934161 RepID=A0ABY4YEY8_9MICO|nr:NAD(P)H-dependent glycerol-3-phosphate dehydrogenase [Ornithinimicrobium cryptoxanthini]USQ75224.1 NAD(P)-dependent glycerol-3-phosphate dehydrogenase [Ornithinimicrobium cryptoxanthini]